MKSNGTSVDINQQTDCCFELIIFSLRKTCQVSMRKLGHLSSCENTEVCILQQRRIQES